LTQVLNVQVKFIFKLVIDGLSSVVGVSNITVVNIMSNSIVLALFETPFVVRIGYGVARGGISTCNQLWNIVFSKVSL